MSDLNVFWVDQVVNDGIPGTGFSAQNMGLVHPSVNSVYDQFIVPIPENPRGLIFKGGTYIKLLLPNENGGNDHLVFGIENDLIVNYPEQRLDVGVSFQAGRDYYIYMCYKAATAEIKTAQADLVISLNSTYPQGYNADTSRKIGGFHTLCANAGAIAGHSLSGFAAGDILPASFWDLQHRPTCQPEGMVYISEIGIWVDIYLQSGTGVNTKSMYGGTITDTQPYSNHIEDLFKAGKTPLLDEEFQCAAEGSNQRTNIQGSSDPVIAGGHVDTGGRRMISNYGLEDCAGAMWQWLSGWSYRPYTELDGGTITTWVEDPSGKGSVYRANALLAGGNWTNGTNSGSRCRNSPHSRLLVNAAYGCRGRARSRVAR